MDYAKLPGSSMSAPDSLPHNKPRIAAERYSVKHG